MIKLNDEYSIDFDPYNLKLCRDVVNKKTGESYRKVVGYYGDFTHLVDRIIEQKIKDVEVDKLQDIVKEIRKTKKEILQKIIEVQPDTKPYKYKLETDKDE